MSSVKSTKFFLHGSMIIGNLKGSFDSFGLISGDKGNMRRDDGKTNIISEIRRELFVTLGLKRKGDKQINDYNVRVRIVRVGEWGEKGSYKRGGDQGEVDVWDERGIGSWGVSSRLIWWAFMKELVGADVVKDLQAERTLVVRLMFLKTIHHCYEKL